MSPPPQQQDQQEQQQQQQQDGGLSALEKERLQCIKRNRAMLEQLDVVNAAQQLAQGIADAQQAQQAEQQAARQALLQPTAAAGRTRRPSRQAAKAAAKKLKEEDSAGSDTETHSSSSDDGASYQHSATISAAAHAGAADAGAADRPSKRLRRSSAALNQQPPQRSGRGSRVDADVAEYEPSAEELKLLMQDQQQEEEEEEGEEDSAAQESSEDPPAGTEHAPRKQQRVQQRKAGGVPKGRGVRGAQGVRSAGAAQPTFESGTLGEGLGGDWELQMALQLSLQESAVDAAANVAAPASAAAAGVSDPQLGPDYADQPKQGASKPTKQRAQGGKASGRRATASKNGRQPAPWCKRDVLWDLFQVFGPNAAGQISKQQLQQQQREAGVDVAFADSMIALVKHLAAGVKGGSARTSSPHLISFEEFVLLAEHVAG